MNEELKGKSWNVLSNVSKIVTSEEARSIIRELRNEQSVGSSDLLMHSGIEEKKFYPMLKKLVNTGLIKRHVSTDRSVSYSITHLGKRLIQEFELLEDKISTFIDLESNHDNSLTNNVR